MRVVSDEAVRGAETMASSETVTFRTDVALVGILVAAALWTAGAALERPNLEWIGSGLTLIATLGAAIFWPARRAGSEPDAQH
jgi:hypothetical protein